MCNDVSCARRRRRENERDGATSKRAAVPRKPPNVPPNVGTLGVRGWPTRSPQVLASAHRALLNEFLCPFLCPFLWAFWRARRGRRAVGWLVGWLLHIAKRGVISLAIKKIAEHLTMKSRQTGTPSNSGTRLIANNYNPQMYLNILNMIAFPPNKPTI